MAKAADVYFIVDPWKIIEEGFDPAYSRVSESVFSLANESMGVRGCFDEGGSVDSLRGAYVNGLYDIAPLPRSYRGIIEKTHFMIPAAEWLMTEIAVDGEKLDLGKAFIRDFRRELDMRSGALSRSFVWRTASGKELRLRFLRFLDMIRRERAYQRVAGAAEFFRRGLFFLGAVFRRDPRNVPEMLLAGRAGESGRRADDGSSPHRAVRTRGLRRRPAEPSGGGFGPHGGKNGGPHRLPAPDAGKRNPGRQTGGDPV